MASGQPCCFSHCRSCRVLLLPGKITRSAGGMGSSGPTNTRSTPGWSRNGSKSLWLLIRGNTGTTTFRAPASLVPAALTLSSESITNPCRYGKTPNTGLPVCSVSQSSPGSNSAISPRNRLMTKPAVLSRSLSEINASVPTSWANTPPLSISPTSNTGQSAASAKPMLAMSLARRLISAGLPAPSAMITS